MPPQFNIGIFVTAILPVCVKSTRYLVTAGVTEMFCTETAIVAEAEVNTAVAAAAPVKKSVPLGLAITRPFGALTPMPVGIAAQSELLQTVLAIALSPLRVR